MFICDFFHLSEICDTHGRVTWCLDIKRFCILPDTCFYKICICSIYIRELQPSLPADRFKHSDRTAIQIICTKDMIPAVK